MKHILFLIALLIAGCGGGASPNTVPLAQSNVGAPHQLQPESWNIGTEIYVATGDGKGDGWSVINVYSRTVGGNAAPVRTITPTTQVGDIIDMAVDGNGYLYTLWYGGFGVPTTIQVFAPNVSGFQSPIRLIDGTNTGLDKVVSLDVQASGQIYVGQNYNGAGTVLVFAPGSVGNVIPNSFIDPNPVPSFIQSARVDEQRLYVSQSIQNGLGLRIKAYHANKFGAQMPLCTIQDSSVTPFAESSIANGPINFPKWIAVSQPSGNINPIVTLRSFQGCAFGKKIVGQNTGLTWARGLAEDGAGTLYELDGFLASGGFSIREFRVGNQSGNVTPNLVISGPNTGLSYPTAITIGR